MKRCQSKELSSMCAEQKYHRGQ